MSIGYYTLRNGVVDRGPYSSYGQARQYSTDVRLCTDIVKLDVSGESKIWAYIWENGDGGFSFLVTKNADRQGITLDTLTMYRIETFLKNLTIMISQLLGKSNANRTN